MLGWRAGLDRPHFVDREMHPTDHGSALVAQAIHEGYEDFLLVGLRKEHDYLACRVFSRPRPRHALHAIIENAASYVTDYLQGVDAAN